jgi:hypothetical protein
MLTRLHPRSLAGLRRVSCDGILAYRKPQFDQPPDLSNPGSEEACQAWRKVFASLEMFPRLLGT